MKDLFEERFQIVDAFEQYSQKADNDGEFLESVHFVEVYRRYIRLIIKLDNFK